MTATRLVIERSGAATTPQADSVAQDRAAHAERGVLGAILICHTVPAEIGTLRPEMFLRESHRLLFAAMLGLGVRGEPIDPITLKAAMNGELERAGGLEYVAALIDEVPTASHIGAHAALVRREAARRELGAVLGAIEAGDVSDGLAARVPDLLCALKECVGAQAFSPPALADFAAENAVPVEWVAQPIAARGAVGVVAGHAKAGKTTFAAELAGADSTMASFLGQPTEGGSVLWIDLEQPKGLTASVLGAHCPGKPPVFVQWGSLPSLSAAGAFCQQHDVNLVIVDSWSKARKGVEDENDPVQTERAMQPWLDFARSNNVAVVFIHHLRKSGGAEGLDLRGTGALAATADIVCTFKRYDPESATDTRRLLEVFSRYGMSKLVIDRVDGRYRVAGTPGQVRRQTERTQVMAVLTEQPQAADEIAQASGLSGPAARTVLKLLWAESDDQRVVTRTGTGRKGDPFRYVKKDCALSNTVVAHKHFGDTP